MGGIDQSFAEQENGKSGEVGGASKEETSGRGENNRSLLCGLESGGNKRRL